MFEFKAGVSLTFLAEGQHFELKVFLYEENLPLDGQARKAKSSSKLVNFPPHHALNEAPVKE